MILAIAIALISFVGGAATAVLVLCWLSVSDAKEHGYPKAEPFTPQPTRTLDWSWPPKWKPAHEYVATEQVR